jgi:sulfur carrier protein ThiS
MVKYHPDKEASKAILRKFTLHKGYDVDSFYQRTRRSKEFSGVIKREYSELCQQIAKMDEINQQDIFDHKTENWMKRYELDHVDFFPAFLLSNLAPAYAARLQKDWDAGKATPEKTLETLLNRTVFQGRRSDIGKYTGKAYWWNAHIDGAKVKYVKQKNGSVRIKPVSMGIDGKIDVRDVLNYYTRTLFPAVYTETDGDLETSDLSFFLSPLARTVYLKADDDFFNRYQKHLPLLNALRTPSHHVRVYDELSKQKKKVVKPYPLSAHLAGNAIDLKSSELTTQEKQYAIDVLEAAGFTRPWKHVKGEEYHFELTGFTDPETTQKVAQNRTYLNALIHQASIQPPLAFTVVNGEVVPYYLNQNTKISNTPFLGLLPTKAFDKFFNVQDQG